MAELILTAKEKESAAYLEWTDEALGKLVKKTAKFMQDNKGDESTYTVAAATMLVCQVFSANATECTFTLEGVTNPKPIGDWLITVKRSSPAL